jgi:hypothetical protein
MPIEYAISIAKKTSQHQTGESLIDELSENVNAAALDGWEPLGGPFAIGDDVGQAMIRPKKMKKGGENTKPTGKRPPPPPAPPLPPDPFS